MREEYDTFTKKIFCELLGNRGKENVVISPYSILILMAIAAHASSGTTRDEIVNAVLPKGSYEELEMLAAGLISRISEDDDGICTSSATIVRADMGDSIRNTYAGQLKSIFDGELLVDEDLIRCTNDWVDKKTSGMIPKIMDESMKDAVMCLINAILFQDEWAAEYKEDDIKENEKFTNADGSTSTVTMLVSHEDDYVENQYFIGFVKPYKGGFSYMALLPAKEGKSFLLKAIKDTSFSDLYANRTSKEVYVNMPEFTCEFEENLETACKKFGIKTLFKDGADFSNMSNADLKIKGIIHKAKIEVDRQGTRAVATAGIVYVGGAPDFDNFREVILDRPFVYAIIHEETGIPVFVGTVNQMPDEKKTHLDADLFVHPSDKAAMTALKAIPGFSQVMKAFMKIWNEQQYKISNMSTNLRLSEQQMKKYYDMLPPICEKLGIDVPEIYIKLDVNPNAYTYGDTHPFIVLTSGLFETLPDELIPSVIAHECGHIACHHTLYTTMGQMILNGASAFVSGLGNIAIYPIQLAFAYWMRCSELSADRASMICEGNSDHVVETMMRFAGYDKDILAEANVDAFMDQAQEYREMVKGNAWNKTLEFIMFQNYDHPLNAVRALEAHEWEQSDRFKTIISYLDDPAGTRLPLKLNPQKYLRKNANKVDAELFSIGFQEVELIRSTETEEKAKAGEVTAISINGDADCDEDYYFQDAKIVLTFYEPKTEEEIVAEHPTEIKMIEDSKSYLGKECAFVVDTFKELGFTNVEVKEMAISKIGFFTKPDTVAKIILNGVDHFEKDSWHDPDVKITIYYYVKV